MSHPQTLEGWDSLSSFPPKDAIVAFVLRDMVGQMRLYGIKNEIQKCLD